MQPSGTWHAHARPTIKWPQGVCYGSNDIATLDSAWYAYQAAGVAGPAVVLGCDFDDRRRLLNDYPWIESCDESLPCMDKRLVDSVGLVNEAVPVEATGSVLHLDRSHRASPARNAIGDAAQFMHSHESPAFNLREYLASSRKYLGTPELLERLWTLEPEPLSASAWPHPGWPGRSTCATQ